MGKRIGESRAPAAGRRAKKKGRIDEKAMAAFLNGIRQGRTQAEAARAAGFSRSAFARLCNRDAAFAGHYADALSVSSGPRYVSRGKGRPLQLRRLRRVSFTDARKEQFLDHFAGTANLAEAAEAAGVCQATVFEHLRGDEGLAIRFREALGLAHMRLEAELARRRIEGQQRLKEVEPTGEPEPEFERALKLLQRWDRQGGGIGRRARSHGHVHRWSFDDAIKLLARRLKAMEPGGALPPPAEGEGDSPLNGDGEA